METILDIAENIVADPVLDQPEFLELRSRIQPLE